MSRFITVLGISHQVQGLTKAAFQKIDDPSYKQYVEAIICSREFDFVFEEASELGPTIAENISAEFLGAGHYLDVDPHSANRAKFGIPAIPNDWTPLNPSEPGNNDVVCHEPIEVHAKREELWVSRVEAEPFTSALFICGYNHTLSLTFKLQAAGFMVARASTYMPHNKLCTLVHVGTDPSAEE
jgi:hypothetical protein